MALSFTRSAIVLGVLAGGAALALIGCNSAQKNEATTQASAKPAWWAPQPDPRSGAEIWAQTCNHCHNLRSPSTYGPHQWEVALYDMRVRANLTGEEQRKVLAFLKASS
jgi:cytochrome c5